MGRWRFGGGGEQRDIGVLEAVANNMILAFWGWGRAM